MAFVISSACVDVKDGACVDVCPVDCIYVAAAQFYIHPTECIDCGACVVECPVGAVYYDRDPTLGRDDALAEGRAVAYFRGAGPFIRGSRVRDEPSIRVGE